VVITAKIKPNSTKGPLVIEDDGELIVYLREKPKDGEANAALVKLLAKHYGVSRSCVNVVSGHKARTKRVEITR
jgi:uncharacterized protein (TIGR00251 family)